MTWNKHINHISMKIARSIGILYRLKNVYPESVLITIYNTLILPYFHCCLLLGGGGVGSVVKENHSLHLLQKKLCYEVGRILFIYRKKSTKKDKENKTKQRKTMYSEQLYTITILALNKSIQAVQLIY